MNCTKKHNIHKISALVAVVMLACLMLATLSACGLFSTLQTVTTVTVDVDGLTDSADGYVAQLGQSFTLKANWHNKFVTSPQIAWYLQIDEGEKEVVADKTSKNLSYTIVDGKTYAFSVVVDEVESEPIIVKASYATLNNVALSSTTHQISQGVIQQNLNEDAQDVTLQVDWNDEFVNPNVDVTVEWWVDEVKQTNDTETFTYNVSAVASNVDVEIKVVVTQGDVSKSESVILSFVVEYKMLDTLGVTVSATNGQTAVSKIGNFTYLQIVDNYGDDGEATLGTLVTPNGTNLNSQCVWDFDHYNQTQTGVEGAREMVRTFKYGKTIVYATVDNVKSQRVSVYVLTGEQYNAQKSYIEDTFVWYGEEYDHNLFVQSDVTGLVCYAISLHKTANNQNDANAHKIHLGNPIWWSESDTTDDFKSAIDVAHNEGDESGSFSYRFSTEVFFLASTSQFGEPSGACQTTYSPVQANNYVRYGEVATKRSTLPIDAKQGLEVYNSNDLFRAVSSGYKPIFANNPQGEQLSALYQKARKVLLDYVDATMSELDKVKVIYDWIVNEIAYDYQAAEDADTDAPVSGYNAFYLEGVFDDARAVCDGKSKAFALLCGMEGIRSMRISGEVVDAGGHAWNKVLIDANGDGVREWYVVDTTWGDIAGRNNDIEYLTYEYFLVKDSDIASTHITTQAQPTANIEYNPYINEKVTVNGVEYTFDVTSQTQLAQLIKYSRQNGNKMLAVRVANGITLSPGGGWLQIDETKNLYMLYAV